MDIRDFILVVVGIISGALLFYLIGLPLGLISTGEVTQQYLSCPNYTCQFTDRYAIYELVGSQQCSDRVGFLSGTDECSIQLKNTEKEQSAKYTVNFKCRTVDIQMQKTSQEIILAPGQTGDFKIKFSEAGKLDWRCETTNVIASTVKGCSLIQK